MLATKGHKKKKIKYRTTIDTIGHKNKKRKNTIEKYLVVL
jgi:hypothetical protein